MTNGIYKALFDKLNIPKLDLNILTSGFQDEKSVPYANITKVTTNLNNLDTCLNRLEDNIFQISIFDDSFSNLRTKLKTVENTLDFDTLSLSNRKTNIIQFTSRILNEPTKGIYQGILTYLITTQKTFSSSMLTSITPGDNLYEALYSRFLAEKGLSSLVNNFVTTAFGNEDWKFNFLYIPDYSTVKDFITTCSRLESTTFSISIQNDNLDHVNTVLEKVDDIYSYCKLNIDNKRFTNLKWLGNSIIELEKNFWQGSVNYELMLEKDIV